MKVTLLMAISINGYIAGPNDDTDWVKDIDALNESITKWGVVAMGRRTYEECMKYDVFPYKNALNIVMTHNPMLLKNNGSNDQVIFSDASPKEILELVKEKGKDELLLIGGGHLNGSFIKDYLVDEIILDIHPLSISNGIRLFEGEFSYVPLEIIDSKQINDQILQVRYKVVSSV